MVYNDVTMQPGFTTITRPLLAAVPDDFFLQYSITMVLIPERINLRMIDRVVRNSTFLAFFIFNPFYATSLWWSHVGLD